MIYLATDGILALMKYTFLHTYYDSLSYPIFYLKCPIFWSLPSYAYIIQDLNGGNNPYFLILTPLLPALSTVLCWTQGCI